MQVLLGVTRGRVPVMGTHTSKHPPPDTPDRKTHEADTSQTPRRPFTHNIRKHTRISHLGLLHKKDFTANI